MTRVTGARSLLVAVLTAAGLVGAAGASSPAVGDPAPVPSTDPTHASRSTTAPAAPTEPSGSTAASVLIVHVAAPAGGVGDVVGDVVQRAVARVDRQLPDAGLTVRHTFRALRSFSVSVDPADQAAAIARLNATPGVTRVERPVTRTFSDGPNDPQLPRETHYLDAVDAPAAWQTQHGSPAVRIAVVDSGVDVTHPDLRPKIVGTYNADAGGTAIPDTLGHGTFVAGVAAAATDNGVGIAGAGYDSSILGVKIAAPDGSLPIDDEVAGIRWSVAHGADIINLSLGGTDYSASERTAVEDAIRKGVLVVAAAGNDATSQKQYPAAYPGVVSVGATDPAAGTRADFSSYGPWVTLAAPGVGIYSTTALKGSDFFPTRTGYASADGTSFAAPLVAGEAALLKAQRPSLTPAQLRTVLVSSAHGYAQLGLGAGQVDFARAFAHLAPTTTPTAASVIGVQDEIRLGATSSAPTVAFRVDGRSVSAPVAVAGGVASATFDSWGLANGTHTLSATDCSAYGECATTSTSTSFTLANTAPDLNQPAEGATATGRFVVTAVHDGGGGARLLVDSRPAGFAAASPYAFPVNGSALPDGTHSLQVVLCSTDGTQCAGPASPGRSLVTRSLHPVAGALSRTAISPNADAVRDAAILPFTLPDAESATVETIGATGTVVRTAELGGLAAGSHAYLWRGLDDAGAPLPDGPYTVALLTSATVDGQVRDGYAGRVGVVDTVSPSLSAPTGPASTFYPVHDGYRDTFRPLITLGEAARLSLVITDASGRTVTTISPYRHPGPTSVTWNGRDARGRLVPPGRYLWRFTALDPAGNANATTSHPVFVSGERLTVLTSYVTHRGSSYTHAGGTDPCARARRQGSAFRFGVAMTNNCPTSFGDLAYATYGFTVPAAITYRRLAVQVYGRSTHRPSELSASLQRNDGGLEISNYVTVRSAGDSWHTITSLPASGHVTRYRHAYATVLLTARYPGHNDFDLRAARLRVTYVALR